MMYITTVSSILLDLALNLKKSTSYLESFVNNKGFELANQMLIEEKAEAVNIAKLEIFPLYTLSDLSKQTFQAGQELISHTSSEIAAFNKKKSDVICENDETAAVLGELYAVIQCFGPQINAILRIVGNNQEKNLEYLRDELSKEDLNTLATAFSVLSKIALKEYANQSQIIYTVTKYKDKDMFFVLEPASIKLYAKASRIFKNLARDKY